MRQLTIRNIDDEVYGGLRDRARLNRRSLEAEVRTILDEAVRPDRSETVKWAARLRAKLRGHYVGDVTADLRADRDR